MASTRNRAWADVRIPTESLTITGSLLKNLLVDAPTVDTLTAVRIVGDLTVEFDPTSTHSDQLNIIDVGIGVASLEAFNLGTTALPASRAQDEYPPRGWLYINTQPAMNAIDATNQAVATRAARFQFDIRSMRKIDKGILYLLIMSSAGKGSGIATLVTGRVRTLCLT